MGFLGFGKKDKVIDLTEKYKKQQQKAAQSQTDSYADLSNSNSSSSSTSSTGAFSIFGGAVPTATQSTSEDSGDEKRKKLAKRLMDITDKLEDLSNQIYHLQQRVEVLEKKTNTGSY